MSPRRPTPLQLVGLGVTFAAVSLFSWYALDRIRFLERLQTETLDRGRRDSLQLVRIQNDLQTLDQTLREMAAGGGEYGLVAYRAPLRRLQGDLDNALDQEARLAPASRTAEQQSILKATADRFWSELSALLGVAEGGREREARALIPTRLEGLRATLASVIARMLVQNNESEAAAAFQIRDIYAGVTRNVYLFLAAVLFAIAVSSFFVIRGNRRLFDQLAHLSEERRTLAGKVISLQEDTFRQLARELHDEFGQVLTAIGMMLVRAERKISPEETTAREQLREVREIANHTLERVRGMSQMLHPPVLDDYGLEKSIEWYLGQFQKQTGLTVHYEKTGAAPFIGDLTAIHVYRIVQEALNNVARHAHTQEAWVRARYAPASLEVEIEDHGAGLTAGPSRPGMGLIAMRERAGLLQGSIEIAGRAGGGTLVRLCAPLSPGLDE